jgi:serine/threonine protein kinase
MAVIQENLVIADRFRLVRMIGRGGMGSVWLADHLGLDIPCAVKFIEGELANVAEAHQRFEREAKAAAQLRSPNVVQIFDHGVWQGHPYIAMELLEGEDLGKRLAKSGGKLSNGEVNFVIQQVCRALSRAHQAGVVHRDLKPDNIYIVKDDDRDIVKILDFGVAKSAAALDGSNTKTGAMLGTPYYMSPEQAQGIKTVDSRSDLWSLAVIVFQCLTGRLPFESEALGDLLVKIIVSPVPTPSQYNPLVPVGFDNWWVKAADRNPDNRYPNAKAFADTLSLALGQSSSSDVTDRNRLQRTSEKPGGATAMMVNGPGTEIRQHVPNTPMPGAHTAALVTPNPAGHGGPQMGQPGPHHGSQPGWQQQQQQQPFANTPQGGYMQGPTTGNPVVGATFSGVEPPAGLPKKGAPIGLFIGIGALAIVGLGLGGVAMVKGRSSGSGGDPMASASAASAAAASASAAVTSATAEASAAPSAVAAVSASAPPDPTAKEPEKPAAPAVPVGVAVHRPVAQNPPPAPIANAGAKTGTTPATKPGTAPPTTPPVAAPGPTKKPLNLGF